MKRRVVVTGLGVLTSIGQTVDEFWKNAKAGKNGVDFISSFSTEGFKTKFASEIKDFDPKNHFQRKMINRLDRFSQFGLVASREAIENSGLDLDAIDMERFGMTVGNGVGGLNTIYDETRKLLESGPSFVSPIAVPKFLPNILAGNLSIEFGIKGVSNTIITACAAGTSAIGDAMRNIQYGDSDIMLAGASEACINPLMLSGFINLNAVSESQDLSRASIPFDCDRSGFVMGEGAGFLILEDLEHALKRNARIYGEIVGYGASSDAYHLTAPDPSLEGTSKAMKNAIKDACIEPSDIEYINTHGTSTPFNDKFETASIKKVFGDHSNKLTLNSTKSMIGHLLGAAGAVEAIASLKSIEEGIIHPTINLNNPDPECDLDYSPNKMTEKIITHAMSNSFGFGGHNASIIFKKYCSK